MTDTPLPATFTRSYNMKKILFTICGRAGSKGVAGKNLKTIYGKPMVYYSLSAIDLFIKENPEYDCDIVLNTDSSLLVDLVTAKYPEVDVITEMKALQGTVSPKKTFTVIAFCKWKSAKTKSMIC